MNYVHAPQIRAARAMLGWSQEHLAEATGLAINTIRNIELGHISPRSATNNVIRRVIEEAGLELIEGDGIKRRDNFVTHYQGLNGCENFWNDVVQTIKKQGNNLSIMIGSQDMLLQACDNDLFLLQSLGDMTTVKCILSEGPQKPLSLPAFQFRVAPKDMLSPVPIFIYGDRYASGVIESMPYLAFVAFRLANPAKPHLRHFVSVWENSKPLSNA